MVCIEITETLHGNWASPFHDIKVELKERNTGEECFVDAKIISMEQNNVKRINIYNDARKKKICEKNKPKVWQT